MLRGYVMVEIRWRVPLTRLGFVHSLVQLEIGWIVNLKLGRALREKWRTVDWEVRGE
jgi:hypothetical protein